MSIKYFDPTINIRKMYNWILNLFIQSDQNILEIINEEEPINLSSDVGLQDIFKRNKNVFKFRIKVQNEYPNFTEEALK